MDDDRSPALLWSADGAPQSGRFGDVYFSREDGLAESRAVFLEGCGLPGAWAGRKRFNVAELGFGTGLNIAALLELWRSEKPQGGRLHIFSVEGYPLSRIEAERALSAWPELTGSAEALLARWPPSTPGLHRLDLVEFDCTFDLYIGDVEEALDQWSGLADAWFLDGFAPSVNPQMWSGTVLDGVARRSAPGARLATFTVAGSVRRGLAERGFKVEKRPGHGRKRERLEARESSSASPPAEVGPRVAIIGAGIAGASLMRAFRAQGLEPVLVEQEQPGAGASGFPAALVTPRLDAGDREIAGLFALALQRAGRLYDLVPEGVVARGVLKLENGPRDQRRHALIADQPHWTAGAMAPLGGPECSELLGEPIEAGGLFMHDALVVNPAAILRDWLGRGEPVEAQVTGLEPSGGLWRLLDAAGDIVLEADRVVIAAGWGSAALLTGLPLAAVAGQADWFEAEASASATWGGYAAQTPSGVLVGATHLRGADDPHPSSEATEAIIDSLQSRLPALADRVRRASGRQSRVGVRATTPDRLPIAGELQPGLWLLGGLGSRGFCAAPLLAEHVAAKILGTPTPLTAAHAARVAPDRFGADLL